VSPKRCQNVLFDGSLPLQSMVPKCTCDVTDMRLDAPKNPPPIVTFSLAHCSIHGSPPKNTCAHAPFCQQPGTGQPGTGQARRQLRALPQVGPASANTATLLVGRPRQPGHDLRREPRGVVGGVVSRGGRACARGRDAGAGRARALRGRASLSCAESSSSTVTMEAREMVTSEYRHMLPMIRPPAPRPYFQLAALIWSARFRSASRSALAAFFSARTSGSLFGFPAFRALALAVSDDIAPCSLHEERGVRSLEIPAGPGIKCTRSSTRLLLSHLREHGRGGRGRV
jgi:hypothetical protein